MFKPRKREEREENAKEERYIDFSSHLRVFRAFAGSVPGVMDE
jgi:hypothetical protein